jgi:hypothetical protein
MNDKSIALLAEIFPRLSPVAIEHLHTHAPRQPCKIPYRLSKLQYIDFTDACYEPSLVRIVATLNTMV